MALFKIVGSSDTKLSLRLEHPIHLDPNKDYSLGLLGLYGKHMLQNIPTTMNFILHVPTKTYGDFRKCSIPIGHYSIEQIEKVIMDNVKLHFPLTIKQGEERLYFIRVDPFTQKVELKLPVDINLFPDSNTSIGYLLGFVPKETVYFHPDRIHLATFLPKLTPYSVIEIHCNLVEPTISNHGPHSHQETDLLYMFHPNPHRFGSTIAMKPSQIHYVPINKSMKTIQTIKLELKNEEGKELNFGCENLIVYLKLNENDPRNLLF